MAAIITRRKWTRQPVGVSGVDWSNPIASGLVFGGNLGDGLANFAGGAIPAMTNSGQTLRDSAGGTGYGGTGGGTSNLAVDQTTANAALTTSAGATVALFRSGGGTSNAGPFALFGQGGWDNLYPYVDGNIYLTFLGSLGAARQFAAVVPAVPVSSTHLLSVQYKSGAQRLAQNGIGIATDNDSTTASAYYTNINSNANGVTDGATLIAFYLWKRYVQDAELEALSDAPFQLFAKRTRRLYFGAAAGGNTYNVSLADVMSILDATSAAAIFAPSIAESLALTDAPSAVMTTNATLAESLTLTDSATAAMIAVASIAESLALADAASAAATFAGTVNESMTVTDAPSAAAVFAASVAETLSIADAPSATAVMNVSVVEVMALSDAPNTGGQASAVSVGESLAFTDTYSATVIFAGTIAESLALTDAPSATAIWNAVIAEVAALSDLPSATAVMGATITEVLGFTDAPSAAGVSVLTTDPWYVARAAGRTFIVSAAGRTFVVRSGGR